MKLIVTMICWVVCSFLYIQPVSAQRSNYTEDDIIIMNNQESVSETIMKLLEEKKTDSALHYFRKKDAAAAKSIKARLTEIANAIQQYKGKYILDVSPDAPNDKDNHYHCKYTNEDGTEIYYKVTFIFDRFDQEYKVNNIVMPGGTKNNKDKPKPKK